MMETYPYSILQIAPDPRRGERINIGLLVFLPNRLDVHMLAQTHKVRVLDPTFESSTIEQLRDFLLSADGDAQTPVEERWALLSRLPGAFLSPLGYFTLQRVDLYEEQVNTLMRQLINTPRRSSAHLPRVSRLESQIRKDLIAMGLFSKSIEDIAKHKIVQRYPIPGEENLVADFAMRNGVLHVCAALDLRGSEETLRLDKFKQGAVKAVTLDRARKTDESCNTFAVIAAPDEVLPIVQPHLTLLHDYAQNVFNLMVPDESAQFYDYIRDISISTRQH